MFDLEHISLLQDNYKTDLTEYDLFDKVVNIKLTARPLLKDNTFGEEEVFVIRSDFETYFPDLLPSVISNDTTKLNSLGKCYIRKCQQKPSLKVSYKRVSLATPIEIDIFIQNFFMLDKTGKLLKTFNNSTYKLIKVDIALGYFKQFESALRVDKDSPIPYENLFNFEEEYLTPYGISVITIGEVTYVTTESLPPDMTVKIHGYVGTFYSEDILKAEKEKEIPNSYQEMLKHGELLNYSGFAQSIYDESEIAKLCFRCITMVFPKNTSSAFKTDADKIKNGVIVYISQSVKDLAGDKKLSDIRASSALKTLEIINTNYLGKKARIIALNTGDVILCTEDDVDSPENIITSSLEKMFSKSVVSQYWKDKLPAIYNISTNAICTIDCPFFFLINPFQKFIFKSRYSLSGLVSYYANFNASDEVFYALWQNVVFATTEPLNSCLITCINQKGEKK